MCPPIISFTLPFIITTLFSLIIIIFVGPTPITRIRSSSKGSDPTSTLVVVVITIIIVVVVMTSRGPYRETSTPTIALFADLGWRPRVRCHLMSVARPLLLFLLGNPDDPFHSYLLPSHLSQ